MYSSCIRFKLTWHIYPISPIRIQTIDLKFLMQPVYPLMELFTGKWGRFKRLGQYMRSTIKTIVDRERKELALEEQQPADQAAAASKPFNFVRQLLAASYPDGSPLTEADIVDNVLQTILAAKDTTAIVSLRDVRAAVMRWAEFVFTVVQCWLCGRHQAAGSHEPTSFKGVLSRVLQGRSQFLRDIWSAVTLAAGMQHKGSMAPYGKPD